MLEGLYSAASGMDAQQQRLDAISNDIANIDTTGYQSERIGFESLLNNSAGSAGAPGVSVGTGAAAVSLGPSQVGGPVTQTGQPLDLAISGDAYFQVRRGDGSIALTRDGSFQLDAGRRLTNAQGQPVQPPITLPSGVQPSDVKISTDGTLTAAGKKIGQISLVTVPAPEQLTQVSGNLLTPSAASGAVRPASGATLQQGALSGSNVDLASAMTQMMDAQQSYDLSSRAISIEQQMLTIANQIKK
jgi:flagellar basal-body rod protein FlgG